MYLAQLPHTEQTDVHAHLGYLLSQPISKYTEHSKNEYLPSQGVLLMYVIQESFAVLSRTSLLQKCLIMKPGSFDEIPDKQYSIRLTAIMSDAHICTNLLQHMGMCAMKCLLTFVLYDMFHFKQQGSQALCSGVKTAGLHQAQQSEHGRLGASQFCGVCCYAFTSGTEQWICQ